MKRFFNWLASSKGDFLLFIILLILINLVSIRGFFRLDLTAPKSYSLSESSKQLVQTLEDPLSVKVFFSANLPAPYNTNGQYLNDLLTEYKGAANDKFSWESFNMDDPENQTLARNYRLQQIQIQEVKDNEVGFKSAWMGLALIYSDRIETLNGITSTEGLEYELTTKMAKMIAAASTLSGLDGKIKLSLYLSSKLSEFNISNFSAVEGSVLSAFSAVNRKNLDKITYERINPPQEDVAALSAKYGLQTIQWTEKNGTNGTGAIGLVLEYADSFRLVPLQMVSSIFGGYGIAGLDDLETSLEESLKALVTKSETIAYITGHGERSLSDNQTGAANFASLAADWYAFKEINLAAEEIPVNIMTVVINGPQSKISEKELYKIDQFLMRGGNLAVFLDPYIEKQNEMAAYYGAPPEYVKNETGLEKILEKYGAVLKDAYVMDKECYTANEQAYGTMNFYYAPLVRQEQLNKNHPISNNLSYVLFVQTGAIALAAEQTSNVKASVLAKTSDKAWLQKDQIILNPLYITPPSAETMQAENLAVLLEGKFLSAFDKNPEILAEKKQELSSNTHLAGGIQTGKIFMAGSSFITTSAVIDEKGNQPIAFFVRNALDYLQNNEDLCRMRTKGLPLNTLKKAGTAASALAKAVNQYVLPLLTAFAGLLVWRFRSIRRKKIRSRYMNPTGATNDK